jgi:hypothetical protein
VGGPCGHGSGLRLQEGQASATSAPVTRAGSRALAGVQSASNATAAVAAIADAFSDFSSVLSRSVTVHPQEAHTPRARAHERARIHPHTHLLPTRVLIHMYVALPWSGRQKITVPARTGWRSQNGVQGTAWRARLALAITRTHPRGVVGFGWGDIGGRQGDCAVFGGPGVVRGQD